MIKLWLLDLAVSDLNEDEHLEGFESYTEDSGGGRWTLGAAQLADLRILSTVPH